MTSFGCGSSSSENIPTSADTIYTGRYLITNLTCMEGKMDPPIKAALDHIQQGGKHYVTINEDGLVWEGWFGQVIGHIVTKIEFAYGEDGLSLYISEVGCEYVGNELKFSIQRVVTDNTSNNNEESNSTNITPAPAPALAPVPLTPKASYPEAPPSSTPVPKNFAGVTWLHTNVSGWKQTGTLHSVSVRGSLIHLDYDKAGVWPDSNNMGVMANPWIFIRKEDGSGWYAATWEWMRPGQTAKNRSAVNGDHIKQNPLKNWSPKSGHWYGFMVSGLARDGNRNALERTNVLMLRWP